MKTKKQIDKRIEGLKDENKDRTCSNCKDKNSCEIKNSNHGESCQMHNFKGE